MDKTNTSNRRHYLLLFTALCLFAIYLTSNPVSAQILTELKPAETVEEAWQAPDLTALPSEWWSQLEDVSAEVITQRVALFLDALAQRTRGLEGDELITAQNGIAYINSQFELLALAGQGPLDLQFDPPLVKETYFLDDLLDLRSLWRELGVSATQVELEIEQSERKTKLLQDRRDKTLREYASADPESPSRILIGINRVSGRVEYELALASTENARKTIKQIEAQSQLLNEQQAFAQDHLVSTDATLADLQKALTDANANVTAMSKKVAALQPQLLNALSAETVNPSLELVRKQQLTRASAEAELAQLQALLAAAKSNWYHLRADVLEPGYDVQSAKTRARQLTGEALKQADLWSSISQSTLIAPSSDTSLNTVKNFEIAQSVARDTLAFVGQIRSTSDDLLFTQGILTTEFVSAQRGLRNTGARLNLAFGNAWERILKLIDYHLFDISDTPLTPASIFKMLFILGLALGISWFIRYLLARGVRRKRAAQSPLFYALGRILHYIIVIAGSFVALGSIGIDFTSFALIAGALSVGIGFGLQAIVSNFVSGLMLLFEGVLRVGDFIELDSGLRGVVKEINVRATIVTTNDSVDVVVPNSELVTTKLTNWTLRESIGRLRVSFGVAYGTDKELVKKAAIEAISKVDCSLTNIIGREPQIRLSNFGDSALEFTALFWVSRQGVRRPGRTKANFLWELETLFQEYGIEIPFPQRDVHVKSDLRITQDPGPEPDLSVD